MIPAPYMLLARILFYMALVAGVFGYGHHLGEKSVQADWDIVKAKELQQANEILIANEARITKLQQDQQSVNLKVSTDHANQLSQIAAERDAAIAYSKSHGGLRIPSSVCSGQATTRPETASNGGHDGETAGTVELPQAYQDALWAESARADAVVEQARTLQKWVIDNGFYGPQP